MENELDGYDLRDKFLKSIVAVARDTVLQGIGKLNIKKYDEEHVAIYGFDDTLIKEYGIDVQPSDPFDVFFSTQGHPIVDVYFTNNSKTYLVRCEFTYDKNHYYIYDEDLKCVGCNLNCKECINEIRKIIGRKGEQ